MLFHLLLPLLLPNAVVSFTGVSPVPMAASTMVPRLPVAFTANTRAAVRRASMKSNPIHRSFSEALETKSPVYQKYPPSSQRLSSASSSSLLGTNGDEDYSPSPVVKDELIRQTALGLRRLSWFSWWCQVILTTVSSVTLLFAKNVRNSGASGGGLGGLFLASSGIILSIFSIFWTWGGARLARRLVRRAQTTRISAANMTRRAVSIAVAINLLGMFITILGAEQIVGLLAARILSTQGLSPFAPPTATLVAQTIQPLDVLVVQANTNTLLSHFVSLACALSLKKFISRLDPPSTEERRRIREKK